MLRFLCGMCGSREREADSSAAEHNNQGYSRLTQGARHVIIRYPPARTVDNLVSVRCYEERSKAVYFAGLARPGFKLELCFPAGDSSKVDVASRRLKNQAASLTLTPARPALKYVLIEWKDGALTVTCMD
eukprot:TRINITY_DN3712_c0_g1_i1.p1 TRINITY_DN3712_c0_g1~~TRINITY_DN3712_c0_g1_i1.p1  ORF type:complete len:130 (-),score=4.46 TRINITY_DN3712_c0_g1_i1:145-534(-)